MPISQQRFEILYNAADTGDVWEMTYDGGPVWIRAGKVDLGDEKDRGNQALYVDEVRAMIGDHLLECRGKDYYRLTGAGFAAAKEIFQSENLQQVSTAELAKIIKHTAESWQKPDEAIWRELMSRYRWVGCPKEDKALISSLDSVVRPLNNGRTMLPPGVIHLPGAGIPTPPPYYQTKVTLSQAVGLLSRKAPQTTSPKEIEPSIPKGNTQQKVMDEWKATDHRPPNAGWFYLFALILVMGTLAVIARVVSIWVLPVIIVGGLFSITIIGALQLRNDNKIEEKNFLTLMKLAFQKMPLLGKLLSKKKSG